MRKTVGLVIYEDLKSYCFSSSYIVSACRQPDSKMDFLVLYVVYWYTEIGFAIMWYRWICGAAKWGSRKRPTNNSKVDRPTGRPPDMLTPELSIASLLLLGKFARTLYYPRGIEPGPFSWIFP